MKDKVKSFFTYFLIIVFFLCSLFCDFLIIRKMHDNITNIPNVVSVEQKRANDYMNYSIPKSSYVYGAFITAQTTTTPFQAYRAMRSETYGYLDIVDNYLYGINGYIDLCVSNALRYDSTITNYNITFNDTNIVSYSFEIDIEIDLSNINTFTNIELMTYMSAIDRNEIETTLEIYIDGNFYNEYYYYYELGFTPSVLQSFDYNLKSEFINRTFLITYNGGYEDGYTIGYGQAVEIYKDTTEYTDNILDRIWNVFTNATSVVFNVLSFEIIPGIPIFAVLILPIIVAVVLFIFKVLAK